MALPSTGLMVSFPNTVKPAPLFTLFSPASLRSVSVRVYHFVYKHVPVSLTLKPESVGQNHLTVLGMSLS